jgi:hypothetical protein
MSNVGSLPNPGAPCVPAGVTNPSHEFDVFHCGFGVSTQNAVATGSVPHPENLDEARYVDKSGTYSKGLKQPVLVSSTCQHLTSSVQRIQRPGMAIYSRSAR